MPLNPRAEQQMDNQIQQDLGNGLIWVYIVMLDVGLFMAALITALEKNPNWPWCLLALIVAVFASYEYARHRSRHVALARQTPEPLVVPRPDAHWRRRLIIQFSFLTVLFIVRAWLSGDPFNYWALVIIPIGLFIRWQLQGAMAHSLQLRLDAINAQDAAATNSQANK